MDLAEARQPSSPRFGSPSSSDENLAMPENSIFANIAERIGDLSKPVEPSFWLRGLKQPHGNFHSAVTQSHHQMWNQQCDETPSTPSTCSVTGLSETQQKPSASETQSESSSSYSDIHLPESEQETTSEQLDKDDDSDLDENQAQYNGESPEQTSPCSSSQHSTMSPDTKSQNPEHFTWWKLAEEAFKAHFPLNEPNAARTTQSCDSSDTTGSDELNAIHLLIGKLENRIRCGGSTSQSLALVEALKVMMDDSSIIPRRSTISRPFTDDFTPSQSSISIRSAKCASSSISTDRSNLESTNGSCSGESILVAKSRGKVTRLTEPLRNITTCSSELKSNSEAQSCETSGIETCPKTRSEGFSNSDYTATDVLAALAKLLKSSTIGDNRRDSDVISAELSSAKKIGADSEADLQKTNAALRDQISYFTQRLEEAKQLTLEQAENMGSTMATLEQIDQERNLLKDVVGKLKLADLKKGEFILQLQRELSGAEEEKSGYRVLLRETEAGRIKLTEEIQELRTRNEEAERRMYESFTDKEEGLRKLQKSYDALKTQSAQTEQDLVDVIYVCKEYRKMIRPQKNRNITRKRHIWSTKRHVREVIIGNEIPDMDSKGTQSGASHSASFLGDDRKILQKEVSRLSAALQERTLHVDRLEFMLKCEVELNKRLEMGDIKLLMAGNAQHRDEGQQRQEEAPFSQRRDRRHHQEGNIKVERMQAVDEISATKCDESSPYTTSSSSSCSGPVAFDDGTARRIWVPPPKNSSRHFLECRVKPKYTNLQQILAAESSSEKATSLKAGHSLVERDLMVDGQMTPDFGMGSREESLSY